MSNLVFLPEGWEDYLYWQGQDKKTLRRINQLLQDISRSGNKMASWHARMPIKDEPKPISVSILKWKRSLFFVMLRFFYCA